MCESCQAIVLPARGTFRNHCPHCLTSKHVDGEIPGDRLSLCAGLMPTIGYDGVDPDRLVLIQRCALCSHVRRNRQARDDQVEQLFAICYDR